MTSSNSDIQEIPIDDYGGEEEEEEESIYNSDDYISEPLISEKCTLPFDILEFDFSYGYDCKRYFNLTVIDENTVVFASGNYIHFLNVKTKQIWFRRSALGGGIGHIRKNPSMEYNHLAVAECGDNPIIIIYDWPSLDIFCVLKGGSSRIYSNIDYSPDGDLLVSQGGEPDYLITIWNWKKHRILLRTKSYVNDVHQVKFSPYVPGLLTTCGIAHIKFWKMALTFTGLKLKGDVGRFGKTEYSDILGILPMADEKILSGCSWGNILVWDDGLIKLEVLRSLRRKCHDAPIVQFFYQDGELWTVGMDGHIKIWWYEKIDQADPSDEDLVLLIDPSYDFHFEGIMLMCIENQFWDDQQSNKYFAQDGNGGIWLLNLNVDEEFRKPEQLFKCHGGEVVDIAVCPYDTYLISLGKDGKLFVFNYIEQQIIFYHKFPAKGCCLIWLPPELQQYGDEIFAGFDDGHVRVCIVSIPNKTLYVVQTLKTHDKPIAKMSINPSGTVLVTGSEDSTIFMMKIVVKPNITELVPIGFVRTPSIPTCLTWHYELQNVLLIGCNEGKIMEIEVLQEPQDYTEITYILNIPSKETQFVTYKSQIRRDIELALLEEKKEAKVQLKKIELRKLRDANPGLDIDEELYLADSEEDEILPPLFIPESPNKILWLKYTEEKTIWLSMGGYDAGYIYEYTMDTTDGIPVHFKMVDDADDLEISSYVYNFDKTLLIFAMQDGSIRINKVNPEDFRDLSDYWLLPTHDNLNGFIPKMCFSPDEKYFFTCGHDGNIFAFKFHSPTGSTATFSKKPKIRLDDPDHISERNTYTKLSLEEMKLKAEDDRIHHVANMHKAKLKQQIDELRKRYEIILNKNDTLLESQKLPMADLDLDKRVRQFIDGKLKDKLDLVERKWAYDVQKSKVRMEKLLNYMIEPVDLFPIRVSGINKDIYILSQLQRKMGPSSFKLIDYLESEPEEKVIHSVPIIRDNIKELAALKKHESVAKAIEYFLLCLTPAIIASGLPPKLTRMLHKYRDRKLKWEIRKAEWEEFIVTKPKPGINHPEDEANLNEAEKTIGNYHLKTSPNYGILDSQQSVNTYKKCRQLLETREKQFKLRHNFSDKVYAARTEKTNVIDYLKQKTAKLRDVQSELPEELIKQSPNIPEQPESEFMDRNYVIKVTMPSESLSDDLESSTISQPFVEPPTFDEIQKLLMPDGASLPKRNKEIFLIPLQEQELRIEPDSNTLFGLTEDEEPNTPFEIELQTQRLNKKVYEQDKIIFYMNKLIDKFNGKLETLAQERLKLLVDGDLIDIHILSLYRELVILKDFESIENTLENEVQSRLSEYRCMEQVISELKDDIDSHQKLISESHSNAKSVQDKFMQVAQDNKFYNFLKKVFRKKFKPPKIKTDDDSSSESSSSSSSESDEEDDAGSIDSRDFGIIKQDLNVCPKGCDQSLFDHTVSLRQKRYNIEGYIREQTKLLEQMKKEQEGNNKKLGLLNNQYAISKAELERVQAEKQLQLNQVRCIVVLDISQILEIGNCNNLYSNVDDIVIFSRKKLTQLYKRIGELQYETFKEKSKHQIYMQHLKRMHRDITYMQKRIINLKSTVKRALEEKFGSAIDVDEIEKTIIQRKYKLTKLNDLDQILMKKMILELRIKLADVKNVYAKEVEFLTKKVETYQKDLRTTLKENTRRMELLSLISRERNDLHKAILAIPKKKEQMIIALQKQDELQKEIKKLKSVIEEQNKEMQILKDEIQMLKTKGLPPKPIRDLQQAGPSDRGVKEEEEQESDDDYEDLIDFNQLVQKYKQKKQAATKESTEFLPLEAEDIIGDLIQHLLSDLSIELEQKSKENLIKTILSGIMHTVSVTDIIKEIIDNLPFTPRDEHKSLIESAAEDLQRIKEPEVTEQDVEECSKEIISVIIDEVMLVKGEKHEVMARLVEKLLESLPLDFLQKDDSITLIVKKILSELCANLDKEEVLKAVESSVSLQKPEMISLTNLILDKVYATGIDYLYVIK